MYILNTTDSGSFETAQGSFSSSHGNKQKLSYKHSGGGFATVSNLFLPFSDTLSSHSNSANNRPINSRKTLIGSLVDLTHLSLNKLLRGISLTYSNSSF